LTDKKILFILFISIGSVLVALSVYHFLGVSNVAEYVALFTSVSTAIYAILSEPKGRTEPILRITPLLRPWGSISFGNRSTKSNLGLNIWIENIGYSIAKDIEVKCRLAPDASIPLNNNGVFKHSMIAPKEIVLYQAVEVVESNKLLSQQLILEVNFANEDNKKQKPIKKEYPIRELEQDLREVKTS
jgi:hypothetical protein